MTKGKHSAKNKNLNKEDYQLLKDLDNLGVKPKLIIQATGRSAPTVTFVRQSSDFEDYKQKQKERNTKPVKAVKKPVHVTVVSEAPLTPMERQIASIVSEVRNLSIAVNLLLEQENERRSHANVQRWKV